jgi:excisionase family DNA binding protein
MSTAKSNTSGDVLKVPAVARLTGMGASSVYRAVENGLIPHFRCGSAIRFRKSTLETWISGQEAAALSGSK